jgi:hypothetical protein
MNVRFTRSISRLPQLLLAGVILSLGLNPAPVLACAACYGQSDSPLAAGMNYGILSLLGIVGVVLGGIATCFFRMARRQAAVSSQESQASSETTPQPESSSPAIQPQEG